MIEEENIEKINNRKDEYRKNKWFRIGKESVISITGKDRKYLPVTMTGNDGKV
jgi:hypothetical protein